MKYQDTECKKRKKVNVLKKKTKFLKSSGERKACEESQKGSGMKIGDEEGEKAEEEERSGKKRSRRKINIS